MKTLKQKDHWLKIAKHHQEHDLFVQGAWLNKEEKVGDYYRGCEFGCFTQEDGSGRDPRIIAAEQMDMPLAFTYISERIFEKLPPEEAVLLPVLSIEAIKVGKDHNKSINSFFYHLMMDETHGNISRVEKDSEQYNAIKQVADLFLMDESAESAAWSAEYAARSAARSAESAARSAESAARSAEYAARSAAWSAEYAARSAAWSAEYAARSAARSAESAAWSAESAAWSAHWQWQRDLLLKCLAE